MESGPATIGFAVIYRWRLHPGLEARFEQGWRTVTDHLRDHQGGLGSRLHRNEDGTWLAYAQWPDRERWRSSEVRGEEGAAAMALMREAVAESFPPILLEPVADMLGGGTES